MSRNDMRMTVETALARHLGPLRDDVAEIKRALSTGAAIRPDPAAAPVLSAFASGAGGVEEAAAAATAARAGAGGMSSAWTAHRRRLIARRGFDVY
jgi:hypothetical protein